MMMNDLLPREGLLLLTIVTGITLVMIFLVFEVWIRRRY
jgi:hypothetical protein